MAVAEGAEDSWSAEPVAAVMIGLATQRQSDQSGIIFLSGLMGEGCVEHGPDRRLANKRCST